MSAPAIDTIDAYIAQFDGEIRAILQKTREVIRAAAPEATEKISWQMPTFYQHGNLVHFAAAKQHLGFYPGERGVACFAGRLTDYRFSKGAIQFPYAKPIPYELIAEITRFRVLEQVEKAMAKAKK